MKFIHYKKNSKDAILLLHGGTFVNGDETYNSSQSKYISDKLDINVYTLGFSTEGLSESKRDIIIFYNNLSEIYENISIIGTSSGGYLALECYNDLCKKKKPLNICLLCPPLDPDARCLNNDKIFKMQRKYFKGPSPKAKIIRDFVIFVFADNDDNVPLHTVKDYAMKYPRKCVHIINGTHEFSYNVKNELDEILNYLNI